MVFIELTPSVGEKVLMMKSFRSTERKRKKENGGKKIRRKQANKSDL